MKMEIDVKDEQIKLLLELYLDGREKGTLSKESLFSIIISAMRLESEKSGKKDGKK